MASFFDDLIIFAIAYVVLTALAALIPKPWPIGKSWVMLDFIWKFFFPINFFIANLTTGDNVSLPFILISMICLFESDNTTDDVTPRDTFIPAPLDQFYIYHFCKQVQKIQKYVLVQMQLLSFNSLIFL